MSLWKKNEIELLTKWAHQVNKDAHIFRHYAAMYKRRHYIFGIVMAAVAAVFGSTGFVGIAVCEDENQGCTAKTVLEWLNACTDYIFVFVIGIQTVVNFGERSQRCQTISSDLFVLQRFIEEVVALPSTSSSNKETIKKNIRERHEKIMTDLPTIGSSVIPVNAPKPSGLDDVYIFPSTEPSRNEDIKTPADQVVDLSNMYESAKIELSENPRLAYEMGRLHDV